jgi:hypothetical protein
MHTSFRLSFQSQHTSPKVTQSPNFQWSMCKIEQRSHRRFRNVFAGAPTKRGGSDARSHGYIPLRQHPFSAAAAYLLPFMTRSSRLCLQLRKLSSRPKLAAVQSGDDEPHSSPHF